jgi:hypothetical protein
MSAATSKVPVIGAVLFAGAAAFLVLMQHQSVVRLSKENQALREQTRQLAQVAADNERLSNQLAQAVGSRAGLSGQGNELLRLRGEVGRLRQQGKELEKLREENHRFRVMLATNAGAGSAASGQTGSPDYLPKESWAFAGYASPESSFQSGLWAANNGDVKTFLASITGDMAADVQEDLKNKSEDEMAAKAKAEVANINSFQIVNREYPSSDEIVLTVSIQEAEKTDTAKLRMKRIGNEWKMAGKAQ